MIVNKEGFENLKSRTSYSWEIVVAIYLEDTLGEDSTYYLHVYYYSAVTDDFLHDVIELNEYGDRAESVTAFMEFYRQNSVYVQGSQV